MESIIKPTKNLISLLKKVDDSIDLSDSHFLFPVELLPIAALISEKSLKYIKPTDNKCLGYLDYFKFPDGYTKYETLSSKYIPIYKFSASKNDEKTLLDKSGIIDNLIKICIQKIGSAAGAINALSLAIEEIIDNIEQHSEAKYGWINAQYYSTKGYLDICILDRGITLLGNY